MKLERRGYVPRNRQGQSEGRSREEEDQEQGQYEQQQEGGVHSQRTCHRYHDQAL